MEENQNKTPLIIPPTKKRRGRCRQNPVVDLPDWLPRDVWEEYVKMRLRIRKPMTPLAMTLAIKELDRLRKAGYSPEAVLNQSIFNSWQGLFPVRETLSRERPSRGTSRTSRNWELLERIKKEGYHGREGI